jgi:hypothetical protein
VLSDSTYGWANPSAVSQVWRHVSMVARAGYFGAHNLLSGLPREYSSRLLARAPAISLEKGQALFETGAIGDGC